MADDVIDVVIDNYADLLNQSANEPIFRFTSPAGTYYGTDPDRDTWSDASEGLTGIKGGEGTGQAALTASQPIVNQANKQLQQQTSPGANQSLLGGADGFGNDTESYSNDDPSFSDIATAVSNAAMFSGPMGLPTAMMSLAAQDALGVNMAKGAPTQSLGVKGAIDAAIDHFSGPEANPDISTSPDVGIGGGPNGHGVGGVSDASVGVEGTGPGGPGAGPGVGVGGPGPGVGAADTGVGASPYAAGGPVTPNASSPPVMPGQNPGTADNIPAKLSEGEFVIPADVVRQLGVQHFEKLIEKSRTQEAEKEAQREQEKQQSQPQSLLGGGPGMPKPSSMPAGPSQMQSPTGLLSRPQGFAGGGSVQKKKYSY